MLLKLFVIQEKIFQFKAQKVEMQNPFVVAFIENNLQAITDLLNQKFKNQACKINRI